MKNICGTCLKFKQPGCSLGDADYLEANNPACSNHSKGKYVNEDEPEVLAPESKIAVYVCTAEMVTAQYRRAIAGTLEMLRFGAMLMEVDKDLRHDSITNKYHEGNGGLQAWMEDNCPEVNYKTALRFKRLAEGLQREFKIPAKMRLTEALPEADGSLSASTGLSEVKRARVLEIRAEIWEFVNGKSARQLLFDFGLAEKKPTGGDHRSGMWLTEMEKHRRDVADAKHLWLKDTYSLMLYSQTYKSHLLLDEGVLANVLMRLDTIRDYIRAAQGKKK